MLRRVDPYAHINTIYILIFIQNDDNPANKMEIKLKLFQQFFDGMESIIILRSMKGRMNGPCILASLTDSFIYCLGDCKRANDNSLLCVRILPKRVRAKIFSKQFYDMNYSVESIFTVYPCCWLFFCSG